MKVAELKDVDEVSSLTLAGRDSGPKVRADLVDAELRDLADFVAELYRRVETLRERKRDGRELAAEVLALLRFIVAEETGPYGLENGIPIFFQRLWGEPAISKLLTDLYRQARSVAYPTTTATNSDFPNASICAELEELIQWYEARRRSLLLLDAESDADEDRIFDLKVLHDRVWCGVPGLEVQCGLRLSGRMSEQLWLKVFVRYRGRFIGAHADWSTWVDDAEFFALGGPRDTERVCALVPITPGTQRMVADRVSLFLPYEALDMPPGRIEVGLELELNDSQGERLLFANRFEQLSLPPNDARHSPIPSPQSVGLWPTDLVSGNSIANVRIQRAFRERGLRTDEVLRLSFDLRVAALAGEELRIECRFLDHEGKLIETNEANFRGPDGKFLFRREIYPQRAVARYLNSAIELPRQSMLVPTGIDNILCELTLVSKHGRVLCGEVFPCPVGEARQAAVGPISSSGDSSLARFTYAQASVSLQNLEFAPLLVRPGISCVRMAAHLSSSDWGSQAFRVMFSLELPQDPDSTNESKPLGLYAHSVCVGGEAGGNERLAVTNFRADHLANYLRVQHIDAENLVGRVKVYSADDRLLLNTTQSAKVSDLLAEVSIVPQHSAPQNSGAGLEDSPFPFPADDIALVDVSPVGFQAPSTLRLRIILNMTSVTPEAGRFTLYFELFDEAGQPLSKPGFNPLLDDLPGKLVNFDIYQNWVTVRQRAGVFQRAVEVELELPATSGSEYLIPPGAYLKLMLFTHSGRLVQVLEQSMAPETHLVATSERIEPADQSDLSPDFSSGAETTALESSFATESWFKRLRNLTKSLSRPRGSDKPA